MKFSLRTLLKLTVLLWLSSAIAQQLDIPVNAQTYVPVLKAQQVQYWPDHPWPATLAAQIEKETCISLKHSKCWSKNAALKTEREYGFGFGQFTVAYNKDGSERFNAWRDVKNANREALADWSWENRLDPTLSIRAVVLYDYSIYRVMSKQTPDKVQALKMTFAAYNGGQAGTLKEVRLCASTPNCDSKSWDSRNGKLGVEATSSKSRVKYQGYGLSFFEINRKYPQEITGIRVKKYEPYFKQSQEEPQ